jgi:hypothetical protein
VRCREMIKLSFRTPSEAKVPLPIGEGIESEAPRTREHDLVAPGRRESDCRCIHLMQPLTKPISKWLR